MSLAIIVPAAGRGSRLLPATRALPKELLPVGRRTLLDWIGDEALRAGATDLLIVTSPGKRDLFERHIGASVTIGHPEDEEVARLWSKLRVSYAVQERPAGLGDAVRIGRDAARALGYQAALGVMLPDEIHGGGNTMSRLVAAAARLGGSTIAAVAVASHEVSRYGMLECEHDLDGSNHWESRVLDLIEKPALGDEPSLYASVGRYLLDSAVLDALDEIEPGAGGELQLADAIALSALRGALITALRVDAQRLDLGNWDGYTHAIATLG